MSDPTPVEKFWASVHDVIEWAADREVREELDAGAVASSSSSRPQAA